MSYLKCDRSAVRRKIIAAARRRAYGRTSTAQNNCLEDLGCHKKNPKTAYALGGTKFVASFRFSEPGGNVSGDGAARPDLMRGT
jgi:hypothetical protein